MKTLFIIFSIAFVSCSVLLCTEVQAQPSISIVTNDAMFGESIAAICFNVNITNPAIDTTYVDIAVDITSTASVGSDFTYNPATIAFEPNFTGNQSVCINFNDDGIVEPIEIATLKITNPTNNAVLLDTVINITIYDNDSVTTTNPCADLFISEYVHSIPDNTKALEIYNPTGQVADLSLYSINLYYNGSSTIGNTIPLTGLLNHGDTYIIANPSSDPIVLADTDMASVFINFTGDDAVGLFHNTTLIDVIGTIGQDPGLYWPAGNGQTASATIVRKQNILQGETDWAVSSGQWDVFSQSTYSNLEAHTINGCGFVVPPTISFATSDATFAESIGGLGISVSIFNPLPDSTTVDVVIGSASTADTLTDYNYNPTQITFPANWSGNMTVGIGIIDDIISEPNEIVQLILRNPSNNAVLLDSVWNLTITDDDGTGMNEQISETNFSVSPNPASTELRIKSLASIDSYSIHDVTGRCCIKSNVPAGNSHKIDIRRLEPGCYTLSITGNDKVITQKFVKQQ